MTGEEKRALDAFEDAWHSGSPPRIEDFLPASRELIEELVKVDLEYRWRVTDGSRPRLEDYFSRHPGLGRLAAAPSDLITEEYRVRRQWGDRPGHGEFLARFPGHGEKLLVELRAADAEMGITLDQPELPPAPGALPEVQGYEVLEELGRGGMGVVYLARQTSLGRLVALKMILAGEHAGARELARFRAEAEAVAQLQHPNIVQLHEIGEQHGRPYFALEYLEGGSLAQKLKGAPLGANVAAKLIITLARAVHAAHERGIIHRDLKPANVLLTHADSAADPLGTPKIADFGLAKRMESGGLQTLTGAVLGSPSYMAPEQAAGRTREIGPATDVYALGAILYELITGRPPFRGGTTIETLEQVRFQDPVAPGRLQPGVPRDLETICLKCLEKDARKRYVTAAALAEDLTYFVDRRPIRARPSGIWDRTVKWGRRRPAMAAFVALCAVFAGTVVVGMIVYGARLEAAFDRTERQRSRADENFVKAFDAVNRMLDRVGYNALADVPGMEDKRRQLLEDSVAFYEGLLQSDENADPTVERAFESSFWKLGEVLLNLGRFDEAEKNLRRFIARRELKRSAESSPRDRDEMAKVRLNLGLACLNTDRKAEAAAEYSRAISIWEELAAELPECRQDLARAYNNLANAASDTERAEALHLKALALRTTLLEEKPGSAPLRGDLAQTRYNLGMLYEATGRAPQAETSYRSALAIWEELAASAPGYQHNLAECYSALALALDDGRRIEAETLLKRAVATEDLLARNYPKILPFQVNLARSRHNLAAFYQQCGRLAEAEAALLEAMAIRERLALDPAFGAQQLELAEDASNLGLIYRGLNRKAEARTVLTRAFDTLDRLLRDRPDDGRLSAAMGACAVNLGGVLSDLGAHEEAIERLAKGIAALESITPASPQGGTALGYLLGAHGARAIALDALGRHADAVPDWDYVVEHETNAAARDRYRRWRLPSLAKAGAHARAAAEASSFASRPGLERDDLYEMATTLSRCAGAALLDEKLSKDDRESTHGAYVKIALEILDRLQASGYFRREDALVSLRKDGALDPLRGNDSFKSLIAKLEAP